MKIVIGGTGMFLCAKDALGAKSLSTKEGPYLLPRCLSVNQYPVVSHRIISSLRLSPRRRRCQSGARHGTFAVHLGEQLAQRLPHFPGAVDEAGHHLEQLLFVLLMDDGDRLQNQLHLLQLVTA